MAAAAIKATWATYKPVPTRNVLQLTLEVPLEQQADVFKKLGYPVPGTETWVGVALLNPVPATNSPIPSSPVGSGGSGKRWHEMSRAQQAGVLCNDPEFQQWAGVSTTEAAAEYVRTVCRVRSRSELDNFSSAGLAWEGLVSGFRQSSGQMAERRG